MAFTSGTTDNSEFATESGKWFIGKNFSEDKILKYLKEADEYEMIATFGSRNFSEELYNVANNMPEEALKLRGFRRLVKILELLMDNAYFSLKPEGKKEIETFKNELARVKKLLPLLYETRINQVAGTSKLILNTENYEKALEVVVSIKKQLNVPLDKAGLIYINKDEFDPKAYKEAIKKRIVEEG